MTFFLPKDDHCHVWISLVLDCFSLYPTVDTRMLHLTEFLETKVSTESDYCVIGETGTQKVKLFNERIGKDVITRQQS